MLDYITSELPKLTASKLPLLPRLGIMGHSMGGHGALVAALLLGARRGGKGGRG